MEEWRPVKGFEGAYEVSSYGRVKSLERTVNISCKDGRSFVYPVKERILKHKTDKKGYKCVSLSHNGTMSNKQVNRLVAIAFIPNPDNLPCTNHKDENPANNNVDNLEWCTYQYNNTYGTRIEKMVAKRAKPVQAMKGGVVIFEFPSIQEAGRNGFMASAVCLCCNGKKKQYKGYQWRFKER